MNNETLILKAALEDHTTFKDGADCLSGKEEGLVESFLLLQNEMKEKEQDCELAAELGKVLLEKNIKLTEEIEHMKKRFSFHEDKEVVETNTKEELRQYKHKTERLLKEKNKLETMATALAEEVVTLEEKLATEVTRSKKYSQACAKWKQQRQELQEELEQVSSLLAIANAKTANATLGAKQRLLANGNRKENSYLEDQVTELEECVKQLEYKLEGTTTENARLREQLAEKDTLNNVVATLLTANEALQLELGNTLSMLQQSPPEIVPEYPPASCSL